MKSPILSTIRAFALFVALFIGTGFIAGSIVHFGEGVTIWDSAVLAIGVLLFAVANYIQEFRKTDGNFSMSKFALFMLQSLFLALGIGMASGGTQHFIDTPEYAAVLIPVGLTVGLFTFFWREKLRISAAKWLLTVLLTVGTAFGLYFGLLYFNSIIPSSLRVGHGSHGHFEHEDHHSNTADAEQQMAEMMGITVEELRNQTPEEHMQMMMNMNTNAHDHADEIDTTGLPEAKASEVLRVKDGDTITLNPTLVKKTINGEAFAMYGYNGQIPGPILMAEQGSSITVQVKNEIDMETTVHWHGLRHDNESDGVPDLTQPAITPNGSYTYTVSFPDSGVYWYHPHVREDLQQDKGLYGNILVQPDKDAPVNTEELLILDDLLLDVDGHQIAYGKNSETFSLMGRFGNLMLVNGGPAQKYALEVQKGSVVRFYITNVANTRMFRWKIDGAAMKLVGSDVGLYEKEEWVDSITIAPAERYIVDVFFEGDGTYAIRHESPLATYSLGFVTVTSEDASPSYEAEFNTLQINEDVVADIDNYRKYFDAPVDKTMVLDIEMKGMMGMMDHSMDSMHSPQVMMDHGSTELTAGDESGIEWPAMSTIEWEDTMPGMNAMMTSDDIEWKLVDKDTGATNMDINWQFTKGDVVKIRIENTANSAHPMQHPIHLHGQRFLVLTNDGEENENLVWKDTVLVPTGSTMDILVDMSNPGEWMMHCHIAEHLTNGMMGMFTVLP